MPEKIIVAVQLAGSQEYCDFIKALTKISGHKTRAALVEAAIKKYAEKFGMKAPQRAEPYGTNMFGRPKDKR